MPHAGFTADGTPLHASSLPPLGQDSVYLRGVARGRTLLQNPLVMCKPRADYKHMRLLGVLSPGDGGRALTSPYYCGLQIQEVPGLWPQGHLNWT